MMKKIIKYILILSIINYGCQNSKKKSIDVLSESGIYSAEKFTNLILTQETITDYFKKYPENEFIKNEVKQFYERRNFQFAWFNEDGIRSVVPEFCNQIDNYCYNFNDKTLKIEELDTLITLIKTNKSNINSKDKHAKDLELLLTTTFFKYAKKIHSGQVDNPFNLDWFIPKNKKNYQILLDSLVISNKNNRIWEPTNDYYLKLKEKLQEYRHMEMNGGLPKIITSKKSIAILESDSCIREAKKHLNLTNDLKTNDTSIVFTDSLSKAIKRYQYRNGLIETGILDEKTITKMNKPIQFWIRKIMINMERLRWFPDEMENDFLLINIPDFKLHVFENRKKKWDTKVVVGKEATQTTIFKGNISEIILNPYWVVPNSIIRNEMLPKIKQNPSYLIKNNMQVISGDKIVNPYSINWHNYTKNVPFSIRQKPGIDNALGKIKFNFPNSFDIYLHDTPSKNLFEKNVRAFSHGCIRVQEPRKLALYLLRNNTDWTAEKIDSILKTNNLNKIPMNPTFPVYIVYFTAWIDNQGQINFRNDVYNLDKKLEKEIFEITAL